MKNFQSKIQHYMDAGFPILYLNTYEEGKAEEAVKCAAGKEPILLWDGTDRVCDISVSPASVKYQMELFGLPEILDDRLTYQKKQVIVLKNIETFINDPAVMARLKKIAERSHSGDLDATIVIISPILQLPNEIEKYITVIEMDYLTQEEIRTVIQRFVCEQETSITKESELALANAFKGLSEFEIQNILQLAYAEHGELTTAQFPLIFSQKQQMIKKAGILEMIPFKESVEDIGGLLNLKEWLKRKAKIFSTMDQAREFGVDMPKGVLIAGVPGCGKSLSAKATAQLFNVPLLRLDMGRLLGKYVGESEANMRRAIELAEAISPCILWVDELEKAFAGIGGSGSGAEVTTRLFGSFLTWLQEKETPVFVVATANEITKLPPELLRKGRFDEIFYVGLPLREERQKIFEIHIRKRRAVDLPGIDMLRLVERTDGYSGADIEGVVKEGVELVYTEERDRLTTEDILTVIQNTHCLSEIMKEPIKKMEQEYKERKFKNASR